MEHIVQQCAWYTWVDNSSLGSISLSHEQFNEEVEKDDLVNCRGIWVSGIWTISPTLNSELNMRRNYNLSQQYLPEGSKKTRRL